MQSLAYAARRAFARSEERLAELHDMMDLLLARAAGSSGENQPVLLAFDERMHEISRTMLAQADALQALLRSGPQALHTATYDYEIEAVVSFYLTESDAAYSDDYDPILARCAVSLGSPELCARYRAPHYTGLSALTYDALHIGPYSQRLRQADLHRVGMIHVDVSLVLQSAQLSQHEWQ